MRRRNTLGDIDSELGSEESVSPREGGNKMKFRLMALAALTGFWASPAGAQMVRAQDPQTLVKALQDAGYQAKLGTDKIGDPMITSSVSGTTFHIFFYNCTANKDCATVAFQAGYDLKATPGLARINEWNRTKRFGRAYLDKEEDPILAMDVDLDDGGLSPPLFTDNVEFWVSALADFEKFIGYRK